MRNYRFDGCATGGRHRAFSDSLHICVAGGRMSGAALNILLVVVVLVLVVLADFSFLLSPSFLCR